MANWASRAVRRLDTVDSTNYEARRWAQEGAPYGAVVIAQTQTAGRGRRGRGWISKPGAGLWLSIVLRPSLPPEQWPLLPLCAALATADAVKTACGADAQIKWPNDLLLCGKKFVGILVEREGEAAIAGIGINVKQRPEDFPEELRGHVTSLEAALGNSVSIDAVEAALLDALDARMDTADCLEEYARRCVTIGAAVRVVQGDASFDGIAEAIDGQGALWVRNTATGGRQRVLAGDVSIRNVNGYA